MSFFEEDDEPRTRVRPRRATPSRDTGGSGLAPPDRQSLLVRRLVAIGGVLLLCILFGLLIRSCASSAKKNSLRDYNREVAALVRDSDQQVGKPFFDLMRNPTQGDLSTQINGYKVQADQQYQQAKRISTPGEMEAAQRSFLITMELRRDGLVSIADRIRTALSSDNEAADAAIGQIAGAMQLFLSSDVVYQQRVLPLIDHALRDADIGQQQLQRSQFLPGVEWLDESTVADALGQQLSSTGGGGGSNREPLPGLHGTGLDSVAVGDTALVADAPNRITYSSDTEFAVTFTNQGENDESDIDVVLRIEGGPKPIRIQRTVQSVAAGASATATLGLDSAPPLDTPVTITVQVKPVPGEEKEDNNTAEYQALFSQG